MKFEKVDFKCIMGNTNVPKYQDSEDLLIQPSYSEKSHLLRYGILISTTLQFCLFLIWAFQTFPDTTYLITCITALLLILN